MNEPVSVNLPPHSLTQAQAACASLEADVSGLRAECEQRQAARTEAESAAAAALARADGLQAELSAVQEQGECFQFVIRIWN